MKKYRFFGPLIEKQEQWLNHMAEQGYRLKRVSKLMYEFEPCQIGTIEYCIDFVGNQSLEHSSNYKQFLEELGYRVFYKNVNLNYSVGKIRFRPWGESGGRIATNKSTFNRELLIIEKPKDGRALELHTTNEDRINFLKPERNAWLTISLLALFLSLWSMLNKMTVKYESLILFAIGLILLFGPVLFYQHRINIYKREKNIAE